MNIEEIEELKKEATLFFNNTISINLMMIKNKNLVYRYSGDLVFYCLKYRSIEHYFNFLEKLQKSFPSVEILGSLQFAISQEDLTLLRIFWED